MSGNEHGDAHAHHEHRPIWQYLAIAVGLTLVTGFELGPLFGLYRLPPLLLIALSGGKFFTVVAFYMHLWDDNPVFSRLFAAPLIGASLMVVVLMVLHHTFFPSPMKDPFPVAERYGDIWNQECSSWLKSHRSHRWYCASAPPVDAARVLAETKPVTGAGESKPPSGFETMSADQQLAALKKEGETQFNNNCAACHQQTGLGIPGAYPPLAGSDYIADKNTHVDVILHGLSGEITVNGVKYNNQMTAFGSQIKSDWVIAAIATYERNAWGNEGTIGGMVLPEDVAKLRK